MMLFYLLGTIALAAAVNVVAQRRVFYSALSLIICLCAISGLYMLLQAPFIAAVQVIVYAGAIMVLFLFIIMLLDPFSAALLSEKKHYLGYLGIAMGTATLVLLVPFLLSYDLSRVPRNVAGMTAGTGTTRRIGETIFKEYLLPFEVTSVLILVAIVGSVILAKKRI